MKKFFLFFLTAFLFFCFIGIWSIVDEGYDKQNKTILLLKKFIPTNLSRKIRDTVFIIPNLKDRNKFLSTQVEKYEQGLEGKLFNEQEIISDNKNKKYFLKEFFLPFARLDTRLGWAATENSKRAHYLEIVEDKVIAISGLGETIYFNKKNIFSKKLNQNKILNNISEILNSYKAKLIGIRDLYIADGFVYISMQHKDTSGFTINLYRAKLNYENLKFELFFETNEYWPTYNVFSGGRIENFSDNKILFSIGFAKDYEAPQDKSSLLGKIISIDIATKKYELISYGHRNPQGLFFLENKKLVINTEHGPKGGDEINFNFLKKNEEKNFGWPEVSYGSAYPGQEKLFKSYTFKKTHSEMGYEEPLKYFIPAIGISELFFNTKNNNIYVSSLRAGSIYVYKLNQDLSKILSEDRIFFGDKRIRDLDYDSENDLFFILFEYTPSIGILKYN